MEEETWCKSHDLAVNQCSYRVGAKKEKKQQTDLEQGIWKKKINFSLLQGNLKIGEYIKKTTPMDSCKY